MEGWGEGKAAREEMQRQKSNAEIIFRLPVSWVQISAATEAGRLGKGSWGCVAAGMAGCACVQPAGAQLPCLCSPVPCTRPRLVPVILSLDFLGKKGACPSWGCHGHTEHPSCGVPRERSGSPLTSPASRGVHGVERWRLPGMGYTALGL